MLERRIFEVSLAIIHDRKWTIDKLVTLIVTPV